MLSSFDESSDGFIIGEKREIDRNVTNYIRENSLMEIKILNK